MLLRIIIIIIFVIIFIIKYQWNIRVELPKIEKEKKKKYREQGLEYIGYFAFKCIGCFSDIGQCEDCYICLFEDKMDIQLYVKSENKIEVGIFDIEEFSIKMDSILGIELLTKAQILEQISFGNLTTFGLSKFSMSEKEQKYLIINMKYDNKKVSFILKNMRNNRINLKKQSIFLNEVNRCIKH